MGLLWRCDRCGATSEAGYELPDGWGHEQVEPGWTLVLCPSCLGPTDMKLFPARPEDRLLVWEWANDPQTRAQSFNSDPIGWEEHCKWFDTQDNLLIGWVPVGTVRVADGEISVNVAPHLRGKGYGSQLIRAASAPNTKARIKETNEASLRAFKSAHYTEVSRQDGIVTMVLVGH